MVSWFCCVDIAGVEYWSQIAGETIENQSIDVVLRRESNDQDSGLGLFAPPQTGAVTNQSDRMREMAEGEGKRTSGTSSSRRSKKEENSRFCSIPVNCPFLLWYMFPPEVLQTEGTLEALPLSLQGLSTKLAPRAPPMQALLAAHWPLKPLGCVR